MAPDYEKLVNLDYTAFEHSLDFRNKLDEHGIGSHSIRVEKQYDHDGVPQVLVTASDIIRNTTYAETYRLENVTEEEFEVVMFDTWEEAMKELEA